MMLRQLLIIEAFDRNGLYKLECWAEPVMQQLQASLLV